jgi:hypothetical protein
MTQNFDPLAGVGDVELAAVEFAQNPEPRCPCVLILDISSSMTGEPIRELNEGLAAFRDELLADPVARRRVEKLLRPRLARRRPTTLPPVTGRGPRPASSLNPGISVCPPGQVQRQVQPSGLFHRRELRSVPD